MQLAQDSARHPLALVVVAMKRDFAGFDVLGCWLGDVVQQRRPAQGEPWRRTVKNLQRVAEDVFVATMRGLVVHSAQLWNVGQAEFGQAEIAQ